MYFSKLKQARTGWNREVEVGDFYLLDTILATLVFEYVTGLMMNVELQAALASTTMSYFDFSDSSILTGYRLPSITPSLS